MPDGTFVIIALLVLAVLVAIVLPMAQKTVMDPFVGTSGVASIDNVTTREKYVQIGQQRYNKLSETNDVQVGNFLQSNNPAVLEAGTREISAATRTSALEADPAAPTGLGIHSEKTTFTLPPTSGIIQDATRCEALRGRGACAKLGTAEAANCGICIKEGTAYTRPDFPGKHIGGLLVLPEEKAVAEDAVRGTNATPEYQPTVGACPPGFLFMDRAACEKAVNRQDCREAGESGGFAGGKTAEGLSITVAKCAQVPSAANNLYIYDTKNRTFTLNLRVLTPAGTGICKVFVFNKSGSQIGYGFSEKPGIEFTVPINVPVKEYDDVRIQVVEEVPYRPAGKVEVFQQRTNPNGLQATYNQEEKTAEEVCRRIGASQATREQLLASWNDGAQACSFGWAKGFSGYPSKAFLKAGGCGLGNALNEANWGGKAHSWCYGIKPPQSVNMSFLSDTLPFFNTYGAASEPSQADVPNKWSQHGADYQANYYRAVLLQWESTDGKRKVSFEPTIQRVNGQEPSGVSSDGVNTFKVLRRFGTFSNSSIILAPRPTSSTNILTNQYWIWSNLPLSQQITFDAKIPGTFLDPVYAEDKILAPTGPLLTRPETQKLLRTSPCLAADQRPGSYSIECLTELLVAAGGDRYRGTLARDGLAKSLLPLGDVDKISAYLSGLYTLATTGKIPSGVQEIDKATGRQKDVGMMADITTINDAAQKMFGFDVASPCEDIVVDESGNIGFIPKIGGLSADCLDYLWMNTGNDRSRGNEDRSRPTTLKNTFTSIQDRYSGLRSGEGTVEERRVAPFQACQRSGTLAPISASGVPNIGAMNIANSKGNITAIQNFYDSIHRNANYLGGKADTMVDHDVALQQCYGITRSPDAPSPSCCLSLPKEFTPVRNTKIATLTTSSDYVITFDIKPTGIETSGWGNIFHISDGTDIQSPGARSPAVWFWPGTLNLHIRFSDTSNFNNGFWSIPGCAINKTSNIRIESIGNKLTVVVDGSVYTMNQQNKRYKGAATLYAGSPYYASAKALVTNFCYKPLN